MKSRTFKENLDDLIDYCNTNKRLPRTSDPNGSRLRAFMNRNKDRYTVANLMDKYRKFKVRSRKPIDLNIIEELKSFCESFNRLPNPRYGYEESRLNNFRIKMKDDPEVMSINEKYRKRSRSSYETNLQDLKEFVAKHNRKPKINVREESRLGGFVQRYSEDTNVKDLIGKYKTYRTKSENIRELEEFVETHNRLPRNGVKGDEDRLQSFMSRNSKNIRVREIKAKYSKRLGGN